MKHNMQQPRITPENPMWVLYYIDPAGKDGQFAVNNMDDLKQLLTEVMLRVSAGWQDEQLEDQGSETTKRFKKHLRQGSTMDAWGEFEFLHQWMWEENPSDTWRFVLNKVTKTATAEDFLALFENPAQIKFPFGDTLPTKAEMVQGELMYHAAQIEEVLMTNLTSSGDKEEDCQLVCVLNRLHALTVSVSGIKPEDLK